MSRKEINWNHTKCSIKIEEREAEKETKKTWKGLNRKQRWQISNHSKCEFSTYTKGRGCQNE